MLLVNIMQSLDAIRANLLRVFLTLFIIALGLTALVVVHTSIGAIKTRLATSFSTLGTNTFTITNRAEAQVQGRGVRQRTNPPIEYAQARQFQEEYSLASVSLTASGNFAAQLRYRERETNPNINVIGTDPNYLLISRYLIAEGRMLNSEDIAADRNIVVIGEEIRAKLFPGISAVDKRISIDGVFYTVVGVFEEMGSSGSSGGDKIVVIPLTTLRKNSPAPNRSVTINIFAEEIGEIDYLMEEATGLMRRIRGLRAGQNNTFRLEKSDAFAEQLLENLSILTTAANLIAGITLLGAAIALLNVMLVNVTERTREIGLRKALGATRSSITQQFLIEAVVICQLGGVLGVVLGLLVGNIIGSVYLKGGLLVPWLWVLGGLAACLLTGVAAGIYPAWKAARVDPIDSLRYE